MLAYCHLTKQIKKHTNIFHLLSFPEAKKLFVSKCWYDTKSKKMYIHYVQLATAESEIHRGLFNKITSNKLNIHEMKVYSPQCFCFY